MKHVARGGLVALLAVVALVLVGQREATAGPCKADGQTCRTSRSCCGTSGNNGVCVKASGAKFGTCCTPTSCAAQGAECGDIPNGTCTDTLNCGTCTPPDTCTANVCCTPARCTDTDCGPTDDGCGGTLTCPCEVCNCYCANGTVIPYSEYGCIPPTACEVICSDPFVGESCRIACFIFGSTRTGTLCAPCQ